MQAFQQLPVRKTYKPQINSRQNVGASSAFLLRLVFVMCLCFPLAAILSAQVTTGTAVGTVTDSSHAAVVGSSITLTNMATGDTRTAKSGSAGAYEFVNLQPGQYKLDVQAPAFKHFTQTDITIQVGTSTRVDPTLQVGEVSQSIEITSQAALLETQQASISQVVEGRAVTEMPLNGRDVLNLVEVAPGVIPLQNVQSANAASGATGGFASGNYMLSGGIPNAGSIYVDGGSLNSGYINAIGGTIPSQDAIQEFNVEDNNISPEFGGTENGVITMVTKSGTNQFHGSAFEFLRNTVLDANTFFGNHSSLKRPPLIQNQYGATVGGPIKKDKLFFFFSFEGIRVISGSTSTYTVPTAAEEAGNLSSVTTPIVDPGAWDTATHSKFTPYTSANCPTYDTISGNNCVFTNNQIPTSRFDPTSQAMFAWWAAPLPGTGAKNNYTATLIARPTVDQYLGRGDWDISSKQRFFIRYSYQNNYTHPALNYGYMDDVQVGLSGAHQAVIGDDYTFNATTIMNVRLAYLRYRSVSEPICRPCSVGFTGWPSSTIAQLGSDVVIPYVNVSGFTANGGDGQYIPVHDDDDAISAGITKILGRHTIKFGGEFRRQPNNYGQDNHVYNEAFNFTNDFSGNAFANYLLGDPEQTTDLITILPASMDYYAGLYVNDNFQPNSRLSVNVGLRWEYPGYWTERHNRQAVWLPNAANPLAGALPTLNLKGDVALVASAAFPGRANQIPHYDAFTPRVGFAYRVTNNDVIRGGFGMVDAAAAIVQQNAQPYSSPVNSAYTFINPTTTPVNAFNNPYPTGILQPAGRAANYDASSILGQSVDVPVPNEPVTYVAQWNLDYQRDLGHRAVLDIAYVGLKGVHLPGPAGLNDNGQGLDQLPDADDAMGSALIAPVTNPFYGLITSSGSQIAGPTVLAGQLLRPYPQYYNLFNSADDQFFTFYEGLQMKVQKRIGNSGNLLVSYTWSRDIGNSDTTTNFTSGEQPGEQQDYTNLQAEISQLAFNLPQVLVASYVLDLPFGKGQRFLNSQSGVIDRLVSGWNLDGITQYDSGYPIVFTAQPTYLSQNFGAGTPRPNVTAGCATVNKTGPAYTRISGWFNASCYTQPSNYSFGNEPRVDPNVRTQGNANWDLSLVKGTEIHENLNLQFRAEMFNTFNRTQFGDPNAVCCSSANASFGVVSSQQNLPREAQFALRMLF